MGSLTLEDAVAAIWERLPSDPYNVAHPFDGQTSVPPVFCAFCLLALAFGGRLGALRLFPFQPSINVAFKATVALDFFVWLLAAKYPTLSVLAPSGPLHMLVVFLPQQMLFCLALSFRREVPFMSVFYGITLLCVFVVSYTAYLLTSGVNVDDSGDMVKPHYYYRLLSSSMLAGDARSTCDAASPTPLTLVAVSSVMSFRVLYRRTNRMSAILLVWSTLGFIAYGNCIVHKLDKGGAILLAQIATLAIVKVNGRFVFSQGNERALLESHEKLSDKKRMHPRDVKKVALVLDGFIGPDCVVCGISRTYASWIDELVNQGKQVLVFSAFDASSIEAFFAKRGTRVKAFKLRAKKIVYVKQVYWATSTCMANVRMISRSFAEEKPDVVHSIFDGTSIPVFAWACAHWRIPIVGIMHTDTSVILEKNGANIIAPIILGGQKWQGSLIDSVATRSRSFAKRMLALHNWKCDHVVKPHVNTSVFSPHAASASEISELRSELMFGDGARPDRILVIYAGRLDLDKRIDELVDIIRRVPSAYLAIVGSGALADDLQALHGKENRIYCKPGFVTHAQLARYYCASDLHVSASQMETLGNTVLESLACGTPVATPRAQGFVDSINHGENGVMWKAGDIEDAVRTLQKLCDDRALLRSLANGARMSIESLHCSTTVSDLLQWYALAASIRQTKTFPIVRLVLCTILVTVSAVADVTVIELARRFLERFADKEERDRASSLGAQNA